MTTALVLPATEEPYLCDLTSAEQIHSLVNGWFEILDLVQPGATLWINDEAALTNKPFNQHAMWLLLAHSPSVTTSPFLRGSIVLTGPMRTNEDGLSDVDDYFVDLVIRGSRFTAEVWLKDATDWKDMNMPFDTWKSAYQAVLSLKERWPDVERTRVRPLP
ncbi:DUF3846 domain-containing protein [Rathayibacter sp. AY1C1]|uniref:DUF3846 domain-containing protein n=1 Tax=Rathayibacter sp. AY1C1 TaxID=2080534 RepID=UPI0011B0DF49|nr:DUF3846 domain-containing protein [Rathayibacter sp. AY1C1]